MTQLPQRKNIRLRDYDYSQAGYYFVTLCVKDKRCILWNDKAEVYIDRPPQLSKIGIIVEKAINNIPYRYENTSIDNYVIMPNHIHLIIVFHEKEDGHLKRDPTLSGVINQFKGFVTKQIGSSIWQKSFYDHVIRGEKQYQQICEYIQTNPLKWNEDKYFV